jgi:hypothetical protein
MLIERLEVLAEILEILTKILEILTEVLEVFSMIREVLTEKIKENNIKGRWWTKIYPLTA